MQTFQIIHISRNWDNKARCYFQAPDYKEAVRMVRRKLGKPLPVNMCVQSVRD